MQYMKIKLFEEFNLPLKAVVIRLKFNNRILLLERNEYDRTYPGWCLPGGKIDNGESAIDAVKRELYEETKISIEDASYIGEYLSVIKFKDCRIAVYEKLFDEEPIVTISDEHKSYKWMTMDDIKNVNLAGKTIVAINL